jgi:hypothetical protein
LVDFRWVNKLMSWVMMCTTHFFLTIFTLQSLKQCILYSSFTHFERFKWAWVCFLLMKILSLDPMWKGGILSEREVIEALCVQSPACSPSYNCSWKFCSIHFLVPIFVVSAKISNFVSLFGQRGWLAFNISWRIGNKKWDKHMDD